jgi:hypothetical protein
VDPSQSNSLFVSAEDDVNTYDLIDRSRIVLPFASRVGIEAAMLGKPVVLGTRCFYKGHGFTEDASSRVEYFQMIDKALECPRETDLAQQDRARLIYYVMERCLFVPTIFTPLPDNFLNWSTYSPLELWNMSVQLEIKKALTATGSFPELVFRRQISSAMAASLVS